MNLCGEMNTASMYAFGCSAEARFMSTAVYGAAAAKSKNASAPWRCRTLATAAVSVTMPVTLDAAENDPISRGRPAYSVRLLSSASRSTCPSSSSGMTTTSAIVSRHEISLEWCSNGPTNTTGRSSGGMASRR